jgi:hypothetical protein
VLSYSVGRRRREYGVRAAFGASPGQIRRVVWHDALVVAVSGLTIGVLFAAALARALASLQYGVTPEDPHSWSLVLGLIRTDGRGGIVGAGSRGRHRGSAGAAAGGTALPHARQRASIWSMCWSGTRGTTHEAAGTRHAWGTMSRMLRAIPPRPADTTPEAEEVQMALMRAATVARRLHLAFSLSATAIRLARRAIARAHPSASTEERDLLFVELHYGPDLARDLRSDLERRRPTHRAG